MWLGAGLPSESSLWYRIGKGISVSPNTEMAPCRCPPGNIQQPVGLVGTTEWESMEWGGKKCEDSLASPSHLPKHLPLSPALWPSWAGFKACYYFPLPSDFACWCCTSDLYLGTCAWWLAIQASPVSTLISVGTLHLLRSALTQWSVLSYSPLSQKNVPYSHFDKAIVMQGIISSDLYNVALRFPATLVNFTGGIKNGRSGPVQGLSWLEPHSLHTQKKLHI